MWYPQWRLSTGAWAWVAVSLGRSHGYVRGCWFPRHGRPENGSSQAGCWSDFLLQKPRVDGARRTWVMRPPEGRRAVRVLSTALRSSPRAGGAIMLAAVCVELLRRSATRALLLWSWICGWLIVCVSLCCAEELCLEIGSCVCLQSLL